MAVPSRFLHLTCTLLDLELTFAINRMDDPMQPRYIGA